MAPKCTIDGVQFSVGARWKNERLCEDCSCVFVNASAGNASAVHAVCETANCNDVWTLLLWLLISSAVVLVLTVAVIFVVRNGNRGTGEGQPDSERQQFIEFAKRVVSQRQDMQAGGDAVLRPLGPDAAHAIDPEEPARQPPGSVGTGRR